MPRVTARQTTRRHSKCDLHTHTLLALLLSLRLPLLPKRACNHVRTLTLHARHECRLQRAVAAANANPQGGVIYLPAGTYVLRKPLVITQTKVVLRGDGEGKTTIYIPVSLSDVFQGTWARSTSGAIFSQWSSGGAFINFEGKRQRSRTTKTFLGRIRGGQAVPRYSTVIPVSGSSLPCAALPALPAFFCM